MVNPHESKAHKEHKNIPPSPNPSHQGRESFLAPYGRGFNFYFHKSFKNQKNIFIIPKTPAPIAKYFQETWTTFFALGNSTNQMSEYPREGSIFFIHWD